MRFRSAETFGGRFKDEDGKHRFRDVAKADQGFGRSMKECFKDDRDKRYVESESGKSVKDSSPIGVGNGGE